MIKIREYIVLALLTLTIGAASAASGIWLYRKNTPKPLRLRLGVICPECRKTVVHDFTSYRVTKND